MRLFQICIRLRNGHFRLVHQDSSSSVFTGSVIVLLSEFAGRSGFIAWGRFQLRRLPGRFKSSFLLLYEAAENANLFITVLGEVESKLLSEPQLQKVVVQRFLTDLDLQGGILQGPPLQLLLTGSLVLHEDTIVELTPGADLLDNFLDCSLLRALVLAQVLALRRFHHLGFLLRRL